MESRFIYFFLRQANKTSKVVVMKMTWNKFSSCFPSWRNFLGFLGIYNGHLIFWIRISFSKTSKFPTVLKIQIFNDFQKFKFLTICKNSNFQRFSKNSNFQQFSQIQILTTFSFNHSYSAYFAYIQQNSTALYNWITPQSLLAEFNDRLDTASVN